MNTIKKITTTLNEHRGVIIKRTLLVGVGVVGVTLAAGLIKIKPTDKATETLEHLAEAAKKAAE